MSSRSTIYNSDNCHIYSDCNEPTMWGDVIYVHADKWEEWRSLHIEDANIIIHHISGLKLSLPAEDVRYLETDPTGFMFSVTPTKLITAAIDEAVGMIERAKFA